MHAKRKNKERKKLFKHPLKEEKKKHTEEVVIFIKG